MLNPDDIDVLQHSLGLNYQEQPYRNYYCAEFDDPQCEKLVAIDLMVRGRAINERTYRYYHVTETGKQLALEEMPLKLKLTRAQQKYLNFLNISDCNSDLTFKDFITDRRFRKYWGGKKWQAIE